MIKMVFNVNKIYIDFMSEQRSLFHMTDRNLSLPAEESQKIVNREQLKDLILQFRD